MPSVQSGPLLPRWVCGASCLVGMALLPSLILAVGFFKAPPGTLFASPVLALVFLVCLQWLATGRCPRGLLESIGRAVTTLRGRDEDG